MEAGLLLFFIVGFLGSGVGGLTSMHSTDAQAASQVFVPFVQKNWGHKEEQTQSGLITKESVNIIRKINPNTGIGAGWSRQGSIKMGLLLLISIFLIIHIRKKAKQRR
ncbi:hypothetical protein [Eubacterium barkeri]|uniref:Uncharacterized protein n=1 Tax=Eubacterium barkeri TaxID=1528 RepID=A0A1H3G113_EUBBA|nr:hypothetical protein [Eubacterium barkeri]SDX96785.1 hypothetical protein SAMN04488579_11243 [Eubacterium barkeri]